MTQHLQLIQVTRTHLIELQSWFTDNHQILTWGGPNLSYPMTENEFITVVMGADISSYCLVDEKQQLLAFGQFYNRVNRHHLGRLAVNPKYRGRGLGKTLITQLLGQAKQQNPTKDASLFVFLDNHVAYRCYQSLGFVETPYPDKIPSNMQNCVYMVLPTIN